MTWAPLIKSLAVGDRLHVQPLSPSPRSPESGVGWGVVFGSPGNQPMPLRCFPKVPSLTN